MNTVVVGVDPGANGGVAWFQPGIGAQAVAMPDESGMRELALTIKGASQGLPLRCYVEKVGGYVKPTVDDDRENRQPGHTMFNFGRSTGAIIMALRMVGAEIEEVHPRTWQQPLFLKRSGDSKTAWKNKLKATAQRKFPGIKVTLQKADALLILFYGSLRASAVPSPVAGRNDSTGDSDEGASETLADWKGQLWVLRDGKTLVRRATPVDIAILKRK